MLGVDGIGSGNPYRDMFDYNLMGGYDMNDYWKLI